MARVGCSKPALRLEGQSPQPNLATLANWRGTLPLGRCGHGSNSLAHHRVDNVFGMHS